MSINSLINFKPKTTFITLTPFQNKLTKEVLTCLWAIPFSIVCCLGLYAIYEWSIQILWGLINLGEFRTYNMAKVVAQISFTITLLYLAVRYVHHREQTKKPLVKKQLNEAA